MNQFIHGGVIETPHAIVINCLLSNCTSCCPNSDMIRLVAFERRKSRVGSWQCSLFPAISFISWKLGSPTTRHGLMKNLSLEQLAVGCDLSWRPASGLSMGWQSILWTSCGRAAATLRAGGDMRPWSHARSLPQLVELMWAEGSRPKHLVSPYLLDRQLLEFIIIYHKWLA